jgi:ceramide glucosyltransferase
MAATFGRAALLVLCGGATAYSLFAIVAAREFFSSETSGDADSFPPISILKPICGADENAEANLRSFCEQDYPEFQIVFGAVNPRDPGLAAARHLAEEFAGRDFEVVAGGLSSGANPKVRNLANLEPRARHSLILVSDSDVRVGRDYLRRIVAPLADPVVAVVTSPYRSHGLGFGGILQALGNSTEFQPSVFVARKLEGLRFALGAGILIRRDVLREIGGFAALSGFLADDLMLGSLPAKAGHRVVLAPPVVDHDLGRVSIRALARRQIRWNRGIRAARPWGYAGLLGTQSTVLATLYLFAMRGATAGIAVALVTIAVRLAMAWRVGSAELGDRAARKWLALVPLRDLFGFAFWVAGFFGRTVEWRGSRYRIEPGGRLAAKEGR